MEHNLFSVIFMQLLIDHEWDIMSEHIGDLHMIEDIGDPAQALSTLLLEREWFYTTEADRDQFIELLELTRQLVPSHTELTLSALMEVKRDAIDTNNVEFAELIDKVIWTSFNKNGERKW